MKRLFVLFTVCLCLTGCFKRDNMEDITVYTTIYPIEYVTSRLYGEYGEVKSVYPSGVDIQIEPCDICENLKYTLTDKQLEDYSKADLFIFNSLLYEGTYVKPMNHLNQELKIINATNHLTEDEFYGLEEIWLDPSRLLTVSRTIKNGFGEYVNNYYLKQDIENQFQSLKEDLDKLGSKLSKLTNEASNKTIVVGSDVFQFLSKDKYGLTVYSLEENENLSAKTISDVKTLIQNGTIKYIYIKQYEEPNETIQKLIKGTDVEIIQLHMLTNLTENEKSNKKDYFTIMNENFDLLRKGLY